MNAKTESITAEADDSRYLIERKIGEGGAGAVYLAKDRETGEYVALKRLFRVNAKSVLRLKREFRSLVDINHPHIIKLYDMGRTSEGWFLTMEYVEGTDLTTYLTSNAVQTRATSADLSRTRVLSSFEQLARGIHALHQAGMLHRDLKPSNVLVVDHRVVVLDFGLVRELSVSAATVTEDGAVAGTPAYMAPEQLLGKELDAACDWYAFGAMLYEALSGFLPIDGSLMEILRRKLDSDPAPIQALAPTAPREVLELCMALLRREPSERPNAEQILAVLGRGAERAPASATQTTPQTANDNTLHTETEGQTAAVTLFGREAEIAALWNAWDQAEAGNAVVVHLRGASGAGKSAVVEHFLDAIEQPATTTHKVDALVLRSRCYELEAMPFKALDGVIDALVRHLSYLDDVTVAHVLPSNIEALTQLFPALERLGAVKRLLASSRSTRDAILDRQRAEVALRALLDAVAARRPIVVWIDDLQWGDLDSARILQDWLQRPTHAPILFVFSYRSAEVTTSSCLARLLQRDEATAPARAPEYTIDIAALGSEDIRALCEQRLGKLAQSHPSVLERIVGEAQGSPYLASQLTAVAEAKLARGDSDWSGLTIDALVAQTSELLPPEAKTLLAVLAVAGKPMSPKVALQSAAILRNGRALVHALRGLNLVRSREVGGERLLEVYHDRVRESVQAALTPSETAHICSSLLSTLEFSGHNDPDFLHTLALGAGQREAALRFGHAAAERANATLAFERAAEVYRRCIDLAEPAQAAELWQKLATALGYCGRGAQAADAYLEAAKSASAAEALVLTQLAAAHLLRSGRFEQGETLVRKVFAAADIRVPESDGAVIAAIVWERTCLKFRGVNFQLRAQADVPPELLANYDMLETLSAALQAYDPIRSLLLQLRATRRALEAGEPARLVRSLSRTAAIASMSGTAKAACETDALFERANDLAQKTGVRAESVITAMRAVASFSFGRHQQVLDYTEAALHALRTDPSAETRGNYHRRHIVASLRAGVLYHLGQFQPFVTELTDLLREAHATDNRSLLLQLTANETLLDAIRGEIGLSRARLDRQRQELPKDRFGALHALHMIAVATCARFTGDYAWANERLEGDWKRYLRSPLDRGTWYALLLRTSRANVLLNQCFSSGNDPQQLAMVRDDIAWLDKHDRHAAGSRPAARLAHLMGDRTRAIGLLRNSIAELDASGMVAEAAHDRYALGKLIGGDEGRAACEVAVRLLRERGLTDPLAMIGSYYPEFVASEPA